MWIPAHSQTFSGKGGGGGGGRGVKVVKFWDLLLLHVDYFAIAFDLAIFSDTLPPPLPPRFLAMGLGFRNKTPILPTVKMLGLGGERLTPKVLDHYLQHNLVMPLLFFFSFTHLRNLDHHNLISSSWYYTQDPSVQFHPNPFLRF